MSSVSEYSVQSMNNADGIRLAEVCGTFNENEYERDAGASYLACLEVTTSSAQLSGSVHVASQQSIGIRFARTEPCSLKGSMFRGLRKEHADGFIFAGLAFFNKVSVETG
jgi:hypothetical protein